MAAVTTLPASFTSGQILTATNMNDIRGAFRVLQVIEGSTTTQTQNNTNVYADTTLTASITPSATSSKILAIVNQAGCYKQTDAGSGVNIRLFRGATQIGEHTYIAYTATTSINTAGTGSIFVLDSPATTSALTYKTQFANVVNANGCIVQFNGSRSSIILMEISA